MTHTLVTFLGRPNFTVDGDPGNRMYREATYSFPDERRTSAFFGLALADYLEVDELVILGTSRSMWGVLVSSLADQTRAGVMGDEDDEARIIQLLDAEDAGEVTNKLLTSLTNTMTNAVAQAVGRPVNVKPQLIPFARDTVEQLEILQAVSKAVPDDGDVSFDLTHGFRHLGMVGFLSAFMLEQVKRMNVCGLWYGALDMTHDGITPVLRLDGLSSVRRWMDALNRFDASGDYGVFAPLLKEDHVSQRCVQSLKGAAFHERTLNLSRAAEEIRRFLPTLDNSLQGASELFRHRLRARLEWAAKEDLAEQQCTLAYVYLERRDFMRAAVFGWEAQVTNECVRRCPELDPEDHDQRQQGLRRLRERLRRRRGEDPTRKAFFQLQDIRNALAHVNPPRNLEIRRILRAADTLESRLRWCFECLLNFRRSD